MLANFLFFMRIDEHLFQGFFGIKKKQDAAKYYDTRVEKLLGIDESLDKGISEFKKLLLNHKNKLKAYDLFLQNLDKVSLQALRSEIRKLEGMFDADELSNEAERKHIIRINSTIKELANDEENEELTLLEKDVIEGLRRLSSLIDSLGPLWEAQLQFIEKNDEEILDDRRNIRLLTDILKEEADILRMEDSILREIDLKTGVILRKTSLKKRNLERTKDMNLRYREISHIR
jgi:hypothetical protein